jgi:hypothetical protein
MDVYGASPSEAPDIPKDSQAPVLRATQAYAPVLISPHELPVEVHAPPVATVHDRLTDCDSLP